MKPPSADNRSQFQNPHLLCKTQVPGMVHIQASHGKWTERCCFQHPQLSLFVRENGHEDCTKIWFTGTDAVACKLSLGGLDSALQSGRGQPIDEDKVYLKSVSPNALGPESVLTTFIQTPALNSQIRISRWGKTKWWKQTHSSCTGVCIQTETVDHSLAVQMKGTKHLIRLLRGDDLHIVFHEPLGCHGATLVNLDLVLQLHMVDTRFPRRPLGTGHLQSLKVIIQLPHDQIKTIPLQLLHGRQIFFGHWARRCMLGHQLVQSGHVPDVESAPLHDGTLHLTNNSSIAINIPVMPCFAQSLRRNRHHAENLYCHLANTGGLFSNAFPLRLVQFALHSSWHLSVLFDQGFDLMKNGADLNSAGILDYPMGSYNF